MSSRKSGVNGKVTQLRPTEGKLFRIRITVNPDDDQCLSVVEDLLGKCELSRCEYAGEDGVTTWSMIGSEDLVDQALEGITVTIPIEAELFETDEGCLYFITGANWFQLRGIAEETAQCWCDDSLEDFESEVHQEVSGRIKSEIEDLPWPGDLTGDEIIGKVEDTILENVDFHTASEEEIHEAVWEVYRKLLEQEMGKEDSE